MTSRLKEYFDVVEQIQEKIDKSEIEDSQNGHICNSCGWVGMYAKLKDDLEDISDKIFECPECGSDDLETHEPDLEFIQEHGYSFDELPERYQT